MISKIITAIIASLGGDAAFAESDAEAIMEYEYKKKLYKAQGLWREQDERNE